MWNVNHLNSTLFFACVVFDSNNSYLWIDCARDIDEVLEYAFFFKVIFKKITEFVQRVCVRSSSPGDDVRDDECCSSIFVLNGIFF